MSSSLSSLGRAVSAPLASEINTPKSSSLKISVCLSCQKGDFLWTRKCVSNGQSRTESGELSGRDADAVEGVAECSASICAFIHKRLDDPVEKRSPGVGGAVNRDRAYGGGGKVVVIELESKENIAN